VAETHFTAPRSWLAPDAHWRRNIVVWWAALILAMIGSLVLWISYEHQHTLHDVGPTVQAVRTGWVSLTQSYLALALPEDDGDDATAEAAANLQQAIAMLSRAIALSEARELPYDFRQRVIALRDHLQRVNPDRLTAWRADPALAAEFATLHAEGMALNTAAQAVLDEADHRLDRAATMTLGGMVVLLGGILALVVVSDTARARTAMAHRRLEADARRQARLLAAIAEGTTDAVFVKDLDGTYLYANRATAALAGVPREDCIGANDVALFGAEAAAAFRAHDRRVMAANASETTEEPLPTADGIRTFLATKAPYHDEQGAVIGTIGVSRDITDRIRHEAALRVSEERYRHFLEALPDAVFLQEGDRIVYGNPAYVAMRGANHIGEVIGTSVFDTFPEDVHERVRERIHHLRLTGAPTEPIEIRVRRLDGRTVPVFVAATQLIDRARGSVLVVLRDLTREYQAQAWAQSILDHTIDGIVSSDDRGVITSFNRAAEGIFGYAAADVVGLHVSALIPDLQGADINHRREKVAVRKGGTRFPIDVAVSAFNEGDERHIIAVVRDISDRRRLESELRQAQKMEALGQVAGGVAHDFNNLLTVILGYSELLEDRLPEGDRTRQFAGDIRRATGRAADLTRQLLTFSRRAVVAPRVVDVNAVIKEIQRMLRRVLGEDIELVVVLDAATRPVLIDPGSLEQMIMNLCVNARDAMPTGGRLTLTVGHTERGDGVDAAGSPIAFGKYSTITISDTGEGISAEVLPQIFEPFFTTKGAGKGTGLGLAVVHSIAAQNGGHILIETAPARGTSFTVGLPEADAVVTTGPDVSARAPRGGGETILVVEDEEPVRRLAALALANAGYRVIEASDGSAALKVFDEHRGHVDLVLTDVVMPHLNGRELALALQARVPALPVIYTSGYADDAILRRGISRADVAFLPKPYTPAGLMRTVRDVLDRPKLQS
jgi:two-component system cell cycle sensor histidine kinase/response regulator CckA